MIYDAAVKICSNGYLITYVGDENDDFESIDVLCADEHDVIRELSRWLGCGPKEAK